MGERSSADPRQRVLVVGGPRTGTTWVAETLSQAAGATWINEPDNEWPDPFALRAKLPLGRFPILDAHDQAPPDYARLWRRAFDGYAKGGPLVALNDRLEKRAKTSRDLWRALCDHANPRIAPWLRVLASLGRPPSRQEQATVVVVKSVHSSLAVEWVAASSDPRVLVVHRHLLNTIASWLEFGWGGCYLDTHPVVRERFADPWGFPTLPEDRSLVQAVTWEVALFASVLHTAGERHSTWLSVSHESLCVDPVGGFRQVYADLGLDWTDAAERFIKRSDRPGTGYSTSRVAAEQPDRWKRRLTPEQIRESRSLLAQIRLPWIERVTAELE